MAVPDPDGDAEQRMSAAASPRMRQAYADGRAAALRGEEAAAGCTTTPEGRAFLAGYIAGASARTADAGS